MLQIEKKHSQIIDQVLDRFDLRHHCIVFGSRIKGKARNLSDLDLCLKGASVRRGVIEQIRGALSESELPYAVDVVLYDDCSDEFKEIIDQEGKPWLKVMQREGI